MTQIRGFLAVANHLSFRRAAEELRITQPALSSQIKGMEKVLGVSLLSRTTRQVSLTKEGRRFLPRARRLLDEFETAVGDMAGISAVERGTVSFSCIPTVAAYAFPKIIQEFKQHHPGVRVEMTDDPNASLERRVLNGEVEFGIGGTPGSLSELDFTAMLEDPFLLMCRKDHPLAKLSKVSLRRVLTYPVICLSKGSNVRTTLVRLFSQRQLSFEPEYEVIHHYLLGAMVEAGLGVSLLPSMACEMARSSSMLHTVPLEDRRFTRSVGLITRRGERLSPAANRFYLLAANALVGPRVRSRAA